MNRGEPIAHYVLTNCQSMLGNSALVAAKNYPLYGGTMSGGTCSADGLSLDGSDDYASVSDPTEGGLDFGDGEDFTLTGWFYRETATTDDVILAKRESDESAAPGYLLYVDDSTDLLVFEISDGADEYSLTSTTTFAAAGWHHFAVVWDDDDTEGTRIYIDGLNDRAISGGTLDAVGTLENDKSFELGRTSLGGGLTDRYFDGNLMGIKLYRYALSEQQVRNDRNNGAANFR